jgi:hypothetical protein
MTMLGFVRFGFGEIWCAEVCDSKFVGSVQVAAPRSGLDWHLLRGARCEPINRSLHRQQRAVMSILSILSRATLSECKPPVTQEMVGGTNIVQHLPLRIEKVIKL